MKVCKFGGTSMATAASVTNVKNIILSDPDRKFVVVSAPGKRFSGDTKVTDLLYAAYAEQQKNGDVIRLLDEIKSRFVTLATEMKVEIDWDSEFKTIYDGIARSATDDYAASRGEYLSAVLMAKVLDFDFVDAAELIKFRKDGSFDAMLTNDLVKKRLKHAEKGVVVPGFYGRLPDRTIKTFSRGGSDFTGAIIARGVAADIYENWTDVDGFMVTDPRIVSDPQLIDVLSYEELRELSYMGASVLHPDSVFPVQAGGIPINIRNTFAPEKPGTLILKDVSGYDRPLVTGIAGRKGNTNITVAKAMMNDEVGFCRKVLSVIERYGLSVEHVPTGIDTMSIVISDMRAKHVDGEKLLNDIRGMVNPDSIEVSESMSLIAVVGHGMANTPGTAAKIFTALWKAGVNIRLIDQGSSELNIIIGVEDDDYNAAIAAIYDAFFKV